MCVKAFLASCVIYLSITRTDEQLTNSDENCRFRGSSVSGVRGVMHCLVVKCKIIKSFCGKINLKSDTMC